MSFLGNESGGASGGPGDGRKKPSPARVGIWLVVSAVGIYMIASSLITIIANGG